MLKKILTIFLITVAVIFIISKYNDSQLKSYIDIKLAQRSLTKYKLPPEQGEINIVALTDSNFILPLNVAMYSAIKNKNKDSKYHFYIIGVDLKESDIKDLTKQASDDVKITVIPNTNFYNFYDAKNNMTPHVPNCDFLKFHMPEIFSKFDKVLYIDGDVLVQSDLSDLYRTNIYNYYAGCVQENFIYGRLEDELQIGRYFNNGVMLLNLKRMRKNNISDKMLRYKIFKCPNRFVTQDTFNAVLYPRLKFLNEKYNVTIVDIDTSKYSDVNEYLKSGVIIHFAGKDKPWNSDVLYGSEWHKYKDEMLSKYKED